MCKPSQYINDICSECNPQTYDMTLAKYVGQENIVEVTAEPDYSFAEYLYECCECGTEVWIDEDWVKRNAIDVNEDIKGDGIEMTKFMHAIRLLENGIKEEETRTIHSYQNKERAIKFRKFMLEEMQQELVALKKLIGE